jgi:hypothetical protein
VDCNPSNSINQGDRPIASHKSKTAWQDGFSGPRSSRCWGLGHSTWLQEAGRDRDTGDGWHGACNLWDCSWVPSFWSWRKFERQAGEAGDGNVEVVGIRTVDGIRRRFAEVGIQLGEESIDGALVDSRNIAVDLASCYSAAI